MESNWLLAVEADRGGTGGGVESLAPVQLWWRACDVLLLMTGRNNYERKSQE